MPVSVIPHNSLAIWEWFPVGFSAGMIKWEQKNTDQMMKGKDNTIVSSEWFQRNSGQANDEYENLSWKDSIVWKVHYVVSDSLKKICSKY